MTILFQVILKTTLGDIDIELWAKEAPKVVHPLVFNSITSQTSSSTFISSHILC